MLRKVIISVLVTGHVAAVRIGMLARLQQRITGRGGDAQSAGNQSGPAATDTTSQPAAANLAYAFNHPCVKGASLPGWAQQRKVFVGGDGVTFRGLPTTKGISYSVTDE